MPPAAAAHDPGGSLDITGRLVGSGHPARVEVRAGRVAAIVPLAETGGPPGPWVGPGLVDIQVNGYGGFDVNAAEPGPDQVVGMVRALWARGVTSVCPTVVTQAPEHMRRCLAAVADARRQSPVVALSVPCAHVEGPALAAEDGPRGAHPRRHLRPVTEAEYASWQEVSGGLVGLVTLAPETPGALGFISARAAEGVVAAIGHTAAPPALLAEAVTAGARLSTHLGNGSHALLPRLDNYLWAQLADDRLWASFVFDGHHLPPAVMKVVLRAKPPGKAVLVSDSVALAGLPPGPYRSTVGGEVELGPDGRLSLAGTPYRAGAAASLSRGVANAVNQAGVPLARALRAASANPARLLGLTRSDGRGRLRPGARADLVVFGFEPGDADLRVDMTVVAGTVVYQRAP